MEHNEIIKKLMAKQTSDGRKSVRIPGCTIINTSITEKERKDGDGVRTQISITCDKEFEGYRYDEATGQYVAGKSKNVFPSYLGLVSLLRNNPLASPIVDKMTENDEIMKILINHAKVTIIQEPVEKDEQYVNLWSTVTNPEPYVVPNDSWYSHIESIELSDTAKELITRIIFKTCDLD